MTRIHLVAARLALVVGALVAGPQYAEAQKVTTNYDTKVDFSKYKTYHWVDITGATYPNQLQDQQIRQAIDSSLRMKGLVRQDTGTVSLYVGYQVTVQDQQQLNAYSTGGGMGRGWGWGGGMGGMGVTTATTSTIEVGTLAVDLYDPTMKQLIWQGTATKQLNPSSDAAKNQENLQKATNKLLKDYPPAPKK